VNCSDQIIEFTSRLNLARIPFNLTSVREAIMVTVRGPSTYYEIEFFADGHIEVQTFGPPSPVQTLTLAEIAERVVRDVNG
jgi:hypothetical protein